MVQFVDITFNVLLLSSTEEASSTPDLVCIRSCEKGVQVSSTIFIRAAADSASIGEAYEARLLPDNEGMPCPAKRPSHNAIGELTPTRSTTD
jgi:hypothetical protein